MLPELFLGYQLVHPFGVAVSNDCIFVSDVYLKNVLVFDKEGNFKNSWGATGKMPFEFSPLGIMYHDDVLYVVSKNGNFFIAENYSVKQFEYEGIRWDVLGEYGSDESQFNSISRITVSKDNLLYIADTINKRVQVAEVISYPCD